MTDQFFPSIGVAADDDESPLHEIESLCMKCEQTGITRMLLTSIPFFREVIVVSFRCEHCGNTNNEIQSAGTIRTEGTIYTVRILSAADLNRQIVRSSTCSVSIPEYELTLPANRGQLTTVEGLIRNIIADLSLDQPLRRVQDEPTYTKIEALLTALTGLVEIHHLCDNEPQEEPPRFSSFTVELDDPAGNSFIEFIGSMADPGWKMRTYSRTRQQDSDLGLDAPEKSSEVDGTEVGATSAPSLEGDGNETDAPQNSEVTNDEILTFDGVCPNCRRSLQTRMKKVVIPYFKDVLIMSTNCDVCGYRDNEVKSGSAISDQGKRITLKVEDREDLSRDLLKSETAGFTIPEIDLVLHAGTLGGRFTTVEGILEQVYQELSEKVFAGDSATTEERSAFETFLGKLKQLKSGEQPFTLVLDDPLANSHIQSLYAPDPDPSLTMELYERTWQQNEELGLNDLKVDNY